MRGYEDDYRCSSGEPLYGSGDFDRDVDSGQRDEWQRADEGQRYRGYYDRAASPYDSDSGSGNRHFDTGATAGPYSGRGPKGYRRSDQQLVEEASQRLERDGHIDATDIEVRANDGVIELEGSVNTRAEKRRAEACVESIYGLRDVMNRLRVTDTRAPS
jgi:osmotically-inducible protein OsmY